MGSKWMYRVMALCLMFLLGTVACAETRGEVNGMPWVLDDRGGLTVSGWGTLGVSAFTDRLDITSATIEEGVTEIENFAFVRCRNMTSLDLPASLQAFGVNVVTGCDQLQSIRVAAGNPNFVSDDGVLYDVDKKTLIACPGGKKTVTLPESLECIRMYALGSAAVEELVLPQSLRKIEDGAFSAVPALRAIEIPSGVTSIGDALFAESPRLTAAVFRNEMETLPMSTFAACAMLEKVVLPSGVKNIGMHAFQACVSLESIDLPDAVERLEAFALHYCIRLGYIELPAALQSIGERVFMNDYSLRSVEIPLGVTSIGDSAFFGCRSLTDVYYAGTREQWEAIAVEGGNESLLNATIHYETGMPDSARDAGDEDVITVPTAYGDMTWADSWMSWNEGQVAWRFDESTGTLTLSGTGKIPPMNPENCEGWKRHNLETRHLVIEKGITGIGFQAFGQFRRLQTVRLPAGICRIDYAAFADCNALTEINLPAGLTVFETYVFSACCNLTSVEIPEGVETLPDLIFQSCSQLRRVSIPRSVTGFGVGVFLRCDNLTDVYYAGSEAEWAQITAGEANEWMNTVRVHFGQSLPVDVSLYTALRIPQSTTCIAQEAFAGVGAEVALIPSSCRVIDSRAFADCENLRYVIIPPEASVQVAEDALEGSDAEIRYQ